MATVRSIFGSRARNTAPMAPRPSSAVISYRPKCCIVSIAQIIQVGSEGEMRAILARETRAAAGGAQPLVYGPLAQEGRIYALLAGSLLSPLFSSQRTANARPTT